MPFQITPNVVVELDDQQHVAQLDHLGEPYLGTDDARNDADSLALAYLDDVAEIYRIDRRWLERAAQPPLELPDASLSTELRLAERKALLDTTTVSFAQVFMGIPVWGAGLSVVVHANPLRVTSSHATTHERVNAREPKLDDPFSPGRVDATSFAAALQLPEKSHESLRMHGSRWRVYQFLESERQDSQANERPSSTSRSSGPPSLPLPKLEGIEEGRDYFVAEVLFALPIGNWGEVNWRAFVEPATGAILYLRAFAAAVDALVFQHDPASRSNSSAVVATATDATLNPWRQRVTLAGLNGPVGGVQSLSGTYVSVLDVELPTIAPPTEPVGTNFDFDVHSDGFAGSNAYYIVDSIFTLMESMGFTISGSSGYFDGTTFPVPVDPRGLGGAVNAHCVGDAQGDGIGRLAFGPCVSGTTVGMCTEFQTVVHEFGHALLFDSVHSANFGFCHSAGDSMAVILADPSNLLTGNSRFQTFPWCPIGGTGERFHNRIPASGYAWGGVQDDHGYGSEQILSSTLFRAYQVTGGDSVNSDAATRLATKEQAARYMAYLIFRSIGSLATNPITATPNVGVYATALMNADIGTAALDGIPGGTHNKVIRWTFEQQGWFQAPGAPTPIITAGAPPNVDVYINDGRNGTYSPYLEDFWETTDIWNLTAPNAATSPTDHTTPVLNTPNYCYARVRNRGTQTANNVVVHGFHNRPTTGLVWPGDWQAMTTAFLPAAGAPALSIPSGGAVTVGPFEWTPTIPWHECLLMWVSADGDRANADPATAFPCAAGPTPHWRLVPFDNNVAQRNVAPVPGGGRTSGLLKAFEGRTIWVDNPTEREAETRLELVLPPFLARRGWRARAQDIDKGRLVLKPMERRQVRIGLVPGKDFSAADVRRARGGRRIRVRSVTDGVVTGGMTFEIDPKMKALRGETALARPGSEATVVPNPRTG